MCATLAIRGIYTRGLPGSRARTATATATAAAAVAAPRDRHRRYPGRCATQTHGENARARPRSACEQRTATSEQGSAQADVPVHGDIFIRLGLFCFLFTKQIFEIEMNQSVLMFKQCYWKAKRQAARLSSKV